MNSMFIKLTSKHGKIRINSDRIESYGTITEETYENAGQYVGMTYIIPNGLTNKDDPYMVYETPEEIDALLSTE